MALACPALLAGLAQVWCYIRCVAPWPGMSTSAGRFTDATGAQLLKHSCCLCLAGPPHVVVLLLPLLCNCACRLFEFVMRMLATGSNCLPADGIGAIAQQLAGQLPADSIYTGACCLYSRGVLGRRETGHNGCVLQWQGAASCLRPLPQTAAPTTSASVHVWKLMCVWRYHLLSACMLLVRPLLPLPLLPPVLRCRYQG